MTAYATKEFASKKALKDAIIAGQKLGVYILTPFGNEYVDNGKVAICGPHYPKTHKWYGTATVENGLITKIS